MPYYIYDGERPIRELDSVGYSKGWNIYGKGIDEIVRRWESTRNQWYLVQQNRMGNVTHLMDFNGNTILERCKYDAFGAPTIYAGATGGTILSASAYGNRFFFTGREYNPTFGFYEYRARAYHPGLGRFTSEDPKLFVRDMRMGKAPDDWSFGAHPDEAEFNLWPRADRCVKA